MADSQKHNVVVVVLVLLAVFSVPSHAFSQELQEYAHEFSKRSMNVMEYFGSESTLMRLGGPVFTVITFIVSFFNLWALVTSFLSSSGILGWGRSLGLIEGPTETVLARNGVQREQRLLGHLGDQVKAAIYWGISELENELKKKK